MYVPKMILKPMSRYFFVSASLAVTIAQVFFFAVQAAATFAIAACVSGVGVGLWRHLSYKAVHPSGVG